MTVMTTMRQSHYRDRDEKGIKKQHNQILLDMVLENYSQEVLQQRGHVLYLDGPNALSSQAFVSTFSSLQMAQCSKDDFDHLQQKVKVFENKCINVHFGSMNSCIQSHQTFVSQCQLVYLDGMQCIYGSIEKQMYPLHDLDQILKLCRLSHITIGFTVVSRMYPLQQMLPFQSKTIFESKRPSTTWIWKEFLYPTIVSRGFGIQKIHVYEYCKDETHSAPMVFFAMNLIKTRNVSKKVWFHLHPSRLFRLGFDQSFHDEKLHVKKNTKHYKKLFKKYYDTKKKCWKLPRYDVA